MSKRSNNLEDVRERLNLSTLTQEGFVVKKEKRAKTVAVTPSDRETVLLRWYNQLPEKLGFYKLPVKDPLADSLKPIFLDEHTRCVAHLGDPEFIRFHNNRLASMVTSAGSQALDELDDMYNLFRDSHDSYPDFLDQWLFFRCELNKVRVVIENAKVLIGWMNVRAMMGYFGSDIGYQTIVFIDKVAQCHSYVIDLKSRASDKIAGKNLCIFFRFDEEPVEYIFGVERNDDGKYQTVTTVRAVKNEIVDLTA